MAVSAQNMAARGDSRWRFTLEFRTWNGSAFVWTDYSDRLVDFRGVGHQIEDASQPNSFRMTFGDVIVRNLTPQNNVKGTLDDAFWNDPDTLDGILVNASQPYGKRFYKRMVRVSAVGMDASGAETTFILGTGLVRNIETIAGTGEHVIKVMSLDARATDQRADGDVVERHPIGGTDKTAPAAWTTSDPASDTANVNLYRWREEEPEAEQFHFGWFRNQRFTEIVKRTAWALDDLGVNVEDSTLFTADGREVATIRNVPPDDPSISTGIGDDRSRAIVWNVVRSCLVVAVGHRIYDFNPITNVYTLRNTLTSGRQIVRMWYINEADTNGVAERLVIVSMDVSAFITPASETPTALRTCQMWLTVFDANGSGAYSIPTGGPNETSLGTDLWPGFCQTRSGSHDATDAAQGIGRVNNTTFYPAISFDFGENVFLPFRQTVHVSNAGVDEYGHFQNPINSPTGTPDIDSLFDVATDGEIGISSGETVDRGWANMLTTSVSAVDLAARWTWGGFVAMGVEVYTSGGRLYFATWDSTNGFRLKYYALFGYAGGSYLALDGSSAHVPHFIYAHASKNPERLYVCQMEWTDSGTATYSSSHLKYYDLNLASWVSAAWRSGATGSDQAWTIMEVARLNGSINKLCAILYNRETGKWRFVSDVGTSWANTDSATLSLHGGKDQVNRLEGLHEHEGYSTNRMFFVESGSNFLWSYDGTTLRHENKTPATASAGDPINSDRGLGAPMCSTPANYPDTNTPNGMLFGISANDFVDWTDTSPNGEYILWQFANFFSGVVGLLDFSGMSLWDIGVKLATAYNYVRFYGPDGYLNFKPRSRSGSATYSFNAANKNYFGGQIVDRGWESVINDIVVKPYAVVSEERTSDIIKGESESTGIMDDVAVAGNPGEASQWKVVFTSATAYDLFKLQGTSASATVAKASGDVSTPLRNITDGAYLTLHPEFFDGAFTAGDNFTFWVFEPQESLEQLDFRDWVRVTDATSQNDWHRSRRSGDFDNRFVIKQLAIDYAENVLNYRKDPHAVIRVRVVFDPAYTALQLCAVTDPDLGFTGSETFQIMGVSHSKIDGSESTLTLVKL